MIRNKPTPEGRALGEYLARFCDTEIERYRDTGLAVPRRCDTCAYRAGTYGNGCLPTVADALKCALEGVPFACHEHRKSDAAPVCAGWMILRVNAGEIEAPWDFVGDGSKAA
jgi:hypothetical protein